MAGDVFEAVAICNSELPDAGDHPGPYETVWQLHITSRQVTLLQQESLVLDVAACVWIIQVLQGRFLG